MRRLVLLFVLPLIGCVSASAVPLGQERFPPRATDHEVLVYDRAEDVGRGYDRVGRVVGTGSDDATFAGVVDEIREKARALGADAILLLRVTRSGDGEAGTRWLVDAQAIRWSDA